MMPLISDSKKIKNPFPGLRPFEIDEYRLFFGREGQSDALITRLQRSRFLAIVGTSGSGKSSLVRAGLLPALRGGLMAGAGSGWRIAIMRPGSDPIGNLALALADKEVLLEAGGGLAPAEAQAVIEATLRRGSLGLVEVVRQARLDQHEKLLVVVDQFEELFRFRTARMHLSTGDDAAAFVKLLLEAAQQSELSIYVVPTMRSDFLGDCSQFQGLPEAINDGQYLIPRMTRDERRVAITGPIGVTRGKITEALVNRLMNDVGDNPDQLPILQHALMRTWHYWSVTSQPKEPISLEHYQAIGTMSDALSNHADEAYNELPDERSKHIAEILFKALTERGVDNREIRRPTSLGDVCQIAGASPSEVATVVDVFRGGGRSFLMPPIGVPLQTDTVIDISHESLIRNWRRLMEWVNEEAQSARIYRRLGEATVLHQEGGEGLLQDPGLQIALDWQKKNNPTAAWGRRYHPQFAEALTYLDNSRAARDAAIAERERQRTEQLERERRELEQAQLYAEQQRRAAQRLRRFTFALVIISLLAITAAGASVFGFALARRSAARAATAQQNAMRAQHEAEELTKTLQARSEELGIKTKELQKSVDNYKESEAGRLKQTLIAEERAKAAQESARLANTARQQAEDNAKQSKAAVERGNLIRQGLEAMQREEFGAAKDQFDHLASVLSPLKPGAPHVSGARSLTPEQAAVEIGWAYSNKASAHHKLEQLGEARADYERALEQLEKYLIDRNDPILFDTYHGLAHVYHEIASQGAYTNESGDETKIDAKAYFKLAEDYYLKALKFQQSAVRPNAKDDETEEEATGFTNLARLYRDVGRNEEAEKNFAEAVRLRLKLSSVAEAVDAMKEQGQFYIGLNRFEDAVKVYNRIIDMQENDYDLERGREIADTYTDLGQIYVAENDDEKADNTFKVANLLQQATLKSKRDQAAIESNSKGVTLDDDLDILGDSYIGIDRYAQAEQAYKLALDIRLKVTANDSKRWKSYERLGKLYERYMKNFAKAQDAYYMLVGFYDGQKQEPLKYAAALTSLGSVYARDSSAYSGAEERLKRALEVLANQSDRLASFNTYTVLGYLYRKQNRTADVERVYVERLKVVQDLMSGNVMVRATDISENRRAAELYPTALSDLIDFYLSQNRKADAIQAYRGMLSVDRNLVDAVVNPKVLSQYVALLDEFRSLLKDQNQASERAEVEKMSARIKERTNVIKSVQYSLGVKG